MLLQFAINVSDVFITLWGFFLEVDVCYRCRWLEEASLYVNICLYFPALPVSEPVSASACEESRCHYNMNSTKLFSSVSIMKPGFYMWDQIKQWLSKFAYQCGISSCLFQSETMQNWVWTSECFHSGNLFLSWKEKLVPEAQKQDNTYRGALQKESQSLY